MALAVNGSGTFFKKCDRSNHRPDSNKGCASSTCQHTCDTPERCQHAWTLRYWVNGTQVEKSFKDNQHPTTGRVDYGSGRKLAASRTSPQPRSESSGAGGSVPRPTTFQRFLKISPDSRPPMIPATMATGLYSNLSIAVSTHVMTARGYPRF